MQLTDGALAGVRLIAPRAFPDARGYFFESYRESRFRDAGLPIEWVQDNVSRSARGVLRGLHFQNPNAQSKLVSCLAGAVWDVVVDLRLDSPTFGRWEAHTLSCENHLQLLVPRGFAHGFCALSDDALVHYRCDAAWSPESEHGVAWDDPDLAIAWPIAEPLLSERDRAHPRLRDLRREVLFT